MTKSAIVTLLAALESFSICHGLCPAPVAKRICQNTSVVCSSVSGIHEQSKLFEKRTKNFASDGFSRKKKEFKCGTFS
jgi:hypothetical protein